MQTTIYTDSSGFEILAKEWDDLLEQTGRPLLFMSHLYQSTWWQYLGNDDLLLIAVRSDDGQLLGLAPLYRSVNQAGQQELAFVGCVDVSDYLDLMVDKNHNDDVYQAIINRLADDKIAWDKLYLCSLPNNSVTHTKFADVARSKGWQAEVKQQDVCPVITLPDSWDEYLAGINKKQRHEIRRKIRKIESETETRWYVIDSEDGLEPAIEEFIELHQKSTKDKEDFWSESLISFFKAIITEFARIEWLRLYFIEVNGVKAAAMLGFDFKDELLLYNSGYDPEQFAKLSPGNVLTSYTIRDAIDLGRKRYDFLRGDEVYKFRFGAQAEPVYDLEVFRS